MMNDAFRVKTTRKVHFNATAETDSGRYAPDVHNTIT